MDDDYKLINSPFSRKLTRGGVTIEVLIYRSEDDSGWRLEVVDPEGTSTVWDDTFATERDALDEVYRTIATEGIASFLREPDQRLH